MPYIIKIDVPRSDSGELELHICFEVVGCPETEKRYLTLDREPFTMPEDDTTVLVIRPTRPRAKK